MRRRIVVCVLLLFAGVPASHAQIQGPTLAGGQRAALSLEGFWADTDSGARADGTGGRVGTRLDFERDLGLDEHDTRWIGTATYNFNRRHGLELSYFSLDRHAERTLTDPVSFRDSDFVPASTLTTSMDSEIWRLSYSYAFVDTPRHRAVAQFGLHYARLGIDLSGRRIDDSAHASTNAPLPVLGLDYAYRISPRWMVEMRAQIFRLQVEDVDGRIDNFSALVAFAPLRTVHLFAGYNYYLLDVDLTKRFWRGEAKLDYQGPWAGFVVGFGGKR
jgi:hypothetical protein